MSSCIYLYIYFKLPGIFYYFLYCWYACIFTMSFCFISLHFHACFQNHYSSALRTPFIQGFQGSFFSVFYLPKSMFISPAFWSCNFMHARCFKHVQYISVLSFCSFYFLLLFSLYSFIWMFSVDLYFYLLINFLDVSGLLLNSPILFITQLMYFLSSRILIQFFKDFVPHWNYPHFSWFFWTY